MNHNTLLRDKKRLALATLFISLSIFGFANIYMMSVIRSLYPAYILIFVFVLSILLSVSGLGLILKKKWAFYAFLGFALSFLALAIISQFGLLKQDWIVFFITFLILSILIALAEQYVKKQCVE
jgi:hypothetical protein